MGKLKKLVATACFITMTMGAVAPAQAALKEKDNVWIGTDRKYDEGRMGEAKSKIDRIYGKTVIYTSDESKKIQIYFGKSGKKRGSFIKM